MKASPSPVEKPKKRTRRERKDKTIRSMSEETVENEDKAKKDGETKNGEKKSNEKIKTPSKNPYENIVMPTPSARKRREEELEKEKKRLIAIGFYQPRSDEDDTLEKIASLKEDPSAHDKVNEAKGNEKK
ncbi:unnamed protein product [Caenorhabditis auriculariae]|uniref:Uncharacterized protein n=1 Tax=Caenorhabditis auriculariae TaxID=2777116 RepID=A0A8S1HIR8_9PELO|nr:unnamed protein product [Caenorhabditis auriculariae]